MEMLEEHADEGIRLLPAHQWTDSGTCLMVCHRCRQPQQELLQLHLQFELFFVRILNGIDGTNFRPLRLSTKPG
jgi:hypothetical protein